jgi:hypothetical protein
MKRKGKVSVTGGYFTVNHPYNPSSFSKISKVNAANRPIKFNKTLSGREYAGIKPLFSLS